MSRGPGVWVKKVRKGCHLLFKFAPLISGSEINQDCTHEKPTSMSFIGFVFFQYREFFEEFSDVGLITGDVTINPTASVLVTTLKYFIIANA